MVASLRRTSRVGFTLIELLVVIAIIAILIALFGAGRAKGTLRRGPNAMRQQHEASHPCHA